MKSLLGLLASATLGLSLQTQATNYSDIYVFGDSLSDTGNLQTFSQDPAVPSRFTDGPVAVEVLAAQLGLSITNALHLTGSQQGNNFAVAGAVAIDEDGDESTFDINLPTQVNSFLAFNGYQAPQDALYVLMIGGNDIRAARSEITEGEWGARRAAHERIKRATDSFEAQLTKLVAAGAQNILVVNAPNIGAIPETDIAAEQVLASADSFRDWIVGKKLEDITAFFSLVYNSRLAIAVDHVEQAFGVDILEFDLFDYFSDIEDNYQAYGFTNKDDACIYVFSQGGAFNPECNLSTFVFFDEIHPTTAVHQRAGAALYHTVVGE